MKQNLCGCNSRNVILEIVPTENIEAAVDEFEIETEKMENPSTLSQEEINSLMHHLVYVLVNEFCFGNFDMAYEVLVDNAEIPEDLANELLDF